MTADSARNAAPAPIGGESMHVLIASRIFAPEPSAASFRLGALASALSAKGHDVTVLTVRLPKQTDSGDAEGQQEYCVRRFPVLRDSSGYVRGYLPYLSFDLPLFFRILFGRRAHVIVAEPPPTTGFAVRVAAAIRRIPYVYYAADIWSDGAPQTGAPDWVVRAVRGVELRAMLGARTVLSVSESLTDRLAELGVDRRVLTVGNGVDTRPFCTGGETEEHYRRKNPHEFVYAGTASEWHGATVFVEALPLVLAEVPNVRIRFIGSGSEIAAIQARAAELGVERSVSVEPILAPADLAPVLRGAAAALASIRPGPGNEFTFPTKLYASMLCGTPSIFAGVGPAAEFLRTELGGIPLGLSTELDPSAVAEAMLAVVKESENVEQRMRVVAWALENVSLAAVAEQIVAELERITERDRSLPANVR